MSKHSDQWYNGSVQYDISSNLGCPTITTTELFSEDSDDIQILGQAEKLTIVKFKESGYHSINYVRAYSSKTKDKVMEEARKFNDSYPHRELKMMVISEETNSIVYTLYSDERRKSWFVTRNPKLFDAPGLKLFNYYRVTDSSAIVVCNSFGDLKIISPRDFLLVNNLYFLKNNKPPSDSILTSITELGAISLDAVAVSTILSKPSWPPLRANAYTASMEISVASTKYLSKDIHMKDFMAFVMAKTNNELPEVITKLLPPPDEDDTYIISTYSEYVAFKYSILEDDAIVEREMSVFDLYQQDNIMTIPFARFIDLDNLYFYSKNSGELTRNGRIVVREMSILDGVLYVIVDPEYKDQVDILEDEFDFTYDVSAVVLVKDETDD